MRASWSWGVVAGVIASGCVGWGASDCHFPSLQAAWTEPGLFDALANASRAGRGAVEDAVLGAGFPFSDPALDAAWRQYTLSSVTWWPAGRPPREAGEIEVRIAPPKEPGAGTAHVHVRAPPDATTDPVIAAFRSFAGNVTWASPREIEAASAALLANRTADAFRMGADNKPQVILHGYAVRIDAPLRLDRAYRAAQGSPDPERALPPWPGNAFVEGAGWRLEFHLPLRSADLRHEGHVAKIAVDPRDAARISLLRMNDTAVALPVAHGLLADLGLRAPRLAESDLHPGPIC